MLKLLKYYIVVCALFLSANVYAQAYNEETLPEDVEQMLDSIKVSDLSEAVTEEQEEDYTENEIQELQDAETNFASRTFEKQKWTADTSDKAFDYVRPKPVAKSEPKKIRKKPSFAFSDEMATMLMYGLIAIIIIAVIYAFFGEQFFGRRDKKNENIVASNWEDVESFTEWERAVQEAEAAGDYRLAIRIQFLECLQNLSQAGFIDYKKDSTNAMYISQTRSTEFSKSFAGLCRMFEYTWYGKHGIDSVQYYQTKEQFKVFAQRLA
jgi:hypothetical protein